jgi:hypothetical protein
VATDPLVFKKSSVTPKLLACFHAFHLFFPRIATSFFNATRTDQLVAVTAKTTKLGWVATWFDECNFIAMETGKG